MDGLVARQFELKKREIEINAANKVQALIHDFEKRSMLKSDALMKECYELLAKTACDIVDALLETYEKVEKTTGQNIILERQGEIKEETTELAYREAGKVNETMRKWAQKDNLPPLSELNFFTTNLVNDSIKKAEILIETYQRSKGRQMPDRRVEQFDSVQIRSQLGIAQRCGILNKDRCDQTSFIAEHYKNENIFLDIPYQKAYLHREKALRHVLKIAGLNPVIAKDRITSNDILCKICRLIRTCKYGVADLSLDRHSVSYELGLLHALGLPTCILLQEGKEGGHFGDIVGLEKQLYKKRGVGIKIKLGEWIEHNVLERKKEPLKAFLETHESSEEQYIRFFARANEALKQKTGLHLSAPNGKCYHQIRTSIPGVHFEYGFHGKPRRNTFGIEIHFETKDKTKNILYLNEFKKLTEEIQNITGERLFIDNQWMKKCTRIYLEKSEGEMTEQLLEWIVDKMEMFYKYLTPHLKQIHQKVKEDSKIFE